MRIITRYGTQENNYTPSTEPGVNHISVQIQDDEGHPKSDVIIVTEFGNDEGLYLLPLFIVPGHKSFPGMLDAIMRVIRFVNINGGAFDDAKFVDQEYIRVHRPVPPQPLPVVTPQPSPVIPTPVPLFTGTLTESIAQVEIESVARKHGLITPGDIVRMPTIAGAFSRNYQSNGKLCIVVCAGPKDATFLVKNDFFLNYTGDNYGNRARLGPPIEDERGVSEGAEQKFLRGRMLWRKSTGKVEVYDLKNNRLN